MAARLRKAGLVVQYTWWATDLLGGPRVENRRHPETTAVNGRERVF
jgi:hypothetical protein